MRSLQAMVALARSMSWGSNEAVTLPYRVSWPGTLTYSLKTEDLKHYDYHHWPE